MKVMIVEDDMLVRLGIKSMIPWSELGLEIICEARDGIEALELFTKHIPDITLVDIGLPKMNGLDFIEKAKQIHSNAEFIVLTCNQDFDVVRKSLRLGVHDFVIKSTMEIEELQRIIQELSFRIIARKAKQAHQAGAISSDPLTAMEKNDFFRDLLDGVYTNREVIKRKLHELGIHLLSSGFQAWIIQLNTFMRNGKELYPSDLDKIGYAVGNIACELFRENLISIVKDVRERRWHMLLHYDPISVNPNILVMAVHNYLGFDISIGCSKDFVELNQWYERNQDAETIQLLKYYHRDRNVFDEDVTLADTLPEFMILWKKEALKKLSLLHFDDILQSMETLRKALYIEPCPHPKLVKDLLAQLMLQLQNTYEKYGLPVDSRPNESSLDELFGNNNLTDSLKLVQKEIRLLKGALCEDKGALDKRKWIVAAEQYMDDHPYEEMYLNTIADQLNLSPSYLSRLFKEETGQNFTDFLLNQKVEKAVVLLQNGVGITEIAEKLGYLNLSSFTRMFKKVKGVAPSQFIMR